MRGRRPGPGLGVSDGPVVTRPVTAAEVGRTMMVPAPHAS